MDPLEWKVPVLVSNFGQETVIVEPFSEIGMIAQMSAIQPVMSQTSRPSCDPSILPEHLRGSLDRTSNNLSDSHKGQLANTLLEFVDLFPVPGSALTVMETTSRETLRRPGPNPHRSIHASFDPHVIFMHHIDSNFTYTGYYDHTY